MRCIVDYTAWDGQRRLTVCQDRRERRAVLTGRRALHAVHLYGPGWRFLRTLTAALAEA